MSKRSIKYGPLVRDLDERLDTEHLQFCADQIRASGYAENMWRTSEQSIADAAHLQSMVDRRAQ